MSAIDRAGTCNGSSVLASAYAASHGFAVERVDRLHEALIASSIRRAIGDLPHEKRIRRLVATLAADLLPHLAREENDVYPFLRARVPKLEAVVRLLTSEHQDLRETIQRLEGFFTHLDELSNALEREKVVLNVQESATYLVFLFRNHLRAERESLFRVGDEVLKGDEKNEVLERL